MKNIITQFKLHYTRVLLLLSVMALAYSIKFGHSIVLPWLCGASVLISIYLSFGIFKSAKFLDAIKKVEGEIAPGFWNSYITSWQTLIVDGVFLILTIASLFTGGAYFAPFFVGLIIFNLYMDYRVYIGKWH